MATSRKTTAIKKTVKKAKATPKNNRKSWRTVVNKPYNNVKLRMQNLKARRPHRSFKRTYSRDYKRSLKLPGYWSFTGHVVKTLARNKRTFILLVVVYALLSALLAAGLASQSNYSQLSSELKTTGSEVINGNVGALGQAGILLLTGLTGGIGSVQTGVSQQAQQIFSGLLVLMAWLNTVWLLRAFSSGKKPRLRDSLYNSGSPILSTALVSLVLALQLAPVVIAAIAYGAASASNLLNGGVEAMVFWAAIALLVTLSCYWIMSTFFAMIIVTLPGMYPMQAIKTAGDLVVGRRIRLLLRLLWLGLVVALGWAITIVPLIALETWLAGMFGWIRIIPIVPIALLIASSVTIVWVASYIYLLYRKVVDDGATPA